LIKTKVVVSDARIGMSHAVERVVNYWAKEGYKIVMISDDYAEFVDVIERR